MQINTIGDFRRAVRNGPYAWPGGYPMYWLMADGEACAFDVAKSQRREMLEALRDYQGAGNTYNNDWRPIALEVNWEDAALFCAHTGARIESAYAEDKVTQEKKADVPAAMAELEHELWRAINQGAITNNFQWTAVLKRDSDGEPFIAVLTVGHAGESKA